VGARKAVKTRLCGADVKKYVIVADVAAAELLLAYLAMPDKFIDLLIAVAGAAICAAIPFIYAALFTQEQQPQSQL
jgi:hypothetical protein